MAVRSQHVRQSSPNIFKEINGIQFMFWADTYVDKSKARYVANKAAQGKIDLDPTLRGVKVKENGTIEQIEL